jgi:hypothetical protein
MSEIKAKVDGGKLTITMPFNKKGSKSKSGKTMVVATTNGNPEVKVEGWSGPPIHIGINAYFKPEEGEDE